MPLDTQIALQTRLPQMQSPIATLGGMARLQQDQEDNRQRQLQNEQRQRALDDDTAIRTSLQRTGNPDASIDELYKDGRAQAAGVLSKSLYDHRKAESEEMTRANTNSDKRLTLATQIFQSVNDQASYDTAKAAAGKLLGDDFINQQFGQQYDPEVVKKGVAWGTSRSEYLKQQNDAIANANKAWELQLAQSKDLQSRQENNLKARDYWTKAASGYLSTAGSQDEWDHYQSQLVENGAPADVVAQFGNEYSPKAVAKAKTLGMSQKEGADVSHQKVEESQKGQEIGLRKREIDDREEETGTGTRRGQALTPNKIADINRWKANEYRAIEKDVRANPQYTDADGNITDAATPELAKRKIQVEDSARAQLGQPPLLETEHQLTGMPGKGKELQKIRNVYKSLTGQETPLEQTTKLAAQLKSEKDPAKAAALKKQLIDLRTQYGQMVTAAGGAPQGQ